jgi:toxin ParE1/3/4
MAAALKLRWTPRAVQHLNSVWEYIGQKNVAAADRLVQTILAAVEVLQSHPDLGRKGRAENTRELIVPSTPYIVVYRLRPNLIQVLAVFHAARRWPDSF